MADDRGSASRHFWKNWLIQDALPLWSGVGFDSATGLVHEALDHAGQVIVGLPRRFRVQARQAYVFDTCRGLSLPAALEARLDHCATALFASLDARAFDPDTGHLVKTYAFDGSITEVAGDLYDLAFLFLALSAGLSRGRDLSALKNKAEQALDALKDDLGWRENPHGLLPRRQNPHMHLFESAMAMFRATGEARYAAMAEECLRLLREVFLQPDGRIFEFFSETWVPVPADRQAVEPGHMAEWISLVHSYERLFKQPSGVDLALLYKACRALSCQDETVLPDRFLAGQSDFSRRLWPQSEWVRTHVTLASAGHADAMARLPTLLSALGRDYLNPQVPGGWYDQRDAGGSLVSQNMPASTLYHLVEAILPL